MQKNGEIVTVEKPLNQTQLKNLQNLVAGDFEDLRSQVLGTIARHKRDREAEIEKKYDDPTALDDAKEELRAFKRKFEDQLATLMTKLGKKGIAATPGRSAISLGTQLDSLELSGKTHELREVRNAAANMETTARRVIGRQERDVQRQVILQGITAPGALELVRDLPSADEVLGLVMAELESENSTDIKALMPARKT